MRRIYKFFVELYNTIRYNGLYLLLSLLFPYIIYKLDAGREIIISMAENHFSLNIGLSFLTFTALCFSLWCIPTLSVHLFQFLTDFPNAGKTKIDPDKTRKVKNCLYNQLIRIYNGKNELIGSCQFEKYPIPLQLPIRYLAITPWVLFIITCLNIFGGSIQALIGGIIIMMCIIIIEKYKSQLTCQIEKTFFNSSKGANKFILNYSIYIILYLLAIIIITITINRFQNDSINKWLLCYLNFLLMLTSYSIITFLENVNLIKYDNSLDKNTEKLSFKISNLNYSLLVFGLFSSNIILFYLNQIHQINFLSPVIVIVTISTSLIVFFEIFFTAQYLLIKIVKEPRCNNCSLGYQSINDLNNVTIKSLNFILNLFIIIIINLFFFGASNSHKIRTNTVQQKDYVSDSVRYSLTERFKIWMRNRKIQNDDSVVYLISGQGGGSRAAAWFFMTMNQLDNQDSNFSKKVFSISTVSGSTSGANMFLANKFFNIKISDAQIFDKTSKLYGRNYMSSEFYGLLSGDLIEGIVDFNKQFPRDRNYHLQQEEQLAYQQCMEQKLSSKYFESDFLTPYLDTINTVPLFFINTTIVNYGTRGIFSPVRLDGVSVARDIYAEFKENKCNSGLNIPIITCVNQSQAFPILSAYNYLDCIGRLGDGGISENSGCATTAEIYQKLKQYCIESQRTQVKFVCINISNSSLTDYFPAPYKRASIFSTVEAAINSPFAGNETYAYKNLEKQIGYANNYMSSKCQSGVIVTDTVINCILGKDVTLTRTLAKKSIEEMYCWMRDNPKWLPK